MLPDLKQDLYIAVIHGKTKTKENFGMGLMNKKRKGDCLKEVCVME